MASPNITPGEWEFVEGEPGFMGSLEEPPQEPYPPTIFVSNDEGDFELAQLVEPLYSVEPEDEYDEGLRYCGRAEANGRLMAAAPDLLEAAQMALTDLDATYPTLHAPGTVSALRCAIKKAMGEGS